MPLDRNPMPLMTVIDTVFNDVHDITSIQHVVLHAAVHGWMEGHLASPGHPDGPTHGQDMPSPPFPDPHERELALIIEEVSGQFERGEEPAAAFVAAGRAWAAGRRAGARCSGCSLENSQHPVAQQIRAGVGSFTYSPTA